MEMARTLTARCNPTVPRPSSSEAARSAFLLTMICTSLFPKSMMCPEVLVTFRMEDQSIRRQFCTSKEV